MQLALEIDLSAASLQAQVFKQIHGLIVSGPPAGPVHAFLVAAP